MWDTASAWPDEQCRVHAQDLNGQNPGPLKWSARTQPLSHRGIYVLQDNKFRLLTQMSAGKQYLEHASKYLAFTCGLIRGGLSNLGIKSIVTAEVSSMPACKFQVMIQKL
uniref:Trafficking protein particle complex subunit 6B n=1 Tax=Equus caballus TaxID=9796 RepID=A0A9L0TTG6_HORSE